MKMGFKRFSIVFTFLILFILGIPVWWKTTDTYRANLDFTKISLYNQSIHNQTFDIWPEFKEFLKYTDQVDHDKQIKSSTEYCLSFTLLNSDPESIIPKWNFPYLSNKFIQPFINEISDIANFTIQSKISHYATLLKSPSKSENSFIIPINRLSEYINPNEWRLETTPTNQPTLNFIIYIPQQSQSPLYIQTKTNNKDSNSMELESNSFLIPQWGGVSIHNVNISSSSPSNVVDLTPRLEKEMATFLYQLKELLGLKTNNNNSKKPLKSSKNEVLDASKVEHLTNEEISGAIKRYTAENINISISTLYSLSSLIESLPNMLILDNIGEQVSLAIESLEKSHQALLNKDYRTALLHSKVALSCSEGAFFDKNMLSQLYFPDEHKYAVYTPLFVPVCFPILAGLYQEYKHFANKKKLKRTTESNTDKKNK